MLEQAKKLSDDFSECIFTSDDPEIVVTITHDRDLLVFGGKVEQDYRFLTYRFPDKGGDVVATVYLDDTHDIQITEPVYDKPIPERILFYMQRRFRAIDQLGGSNGYVKLWQAPSTKKHR
jgi:hypothetical protein